MLVGALVAAAVWLVAAGLRRLAVAPGAWWLARRRAHRGRGRPGGEAGPEQVAQRAHRLGLVAAGAGGAALLYAVVLAVAGSPGLAAGAALGGLLFPPWVAEWQRTRNAALVSDQLDAAMAVMAAQLRSGSPVEVAAQRAAEVVGQPLRGVLLDVARETALGRRFADALEEVRQRPEVAGSTDFQVFVTQLCVAQERGANVLPAFESLRAALAERRRYRQVVAEQLGEHVMQTATIAGIGLLVLAAFAWLSPQGLGPLVGTPVGQVVLLGSVLGNTALIRTAHLSMLRQMRRT